MTIGRTLKLKKPVLHYSWKDKRTEEEILRDIEERKKKK